MLNESKPVRTAVDVLTESLVNESTFAESLTAATSGFVLVESFATAAVSFLVNSKLGYNALDNFSLAPTNKLPISVLSYVSQNSKFAVPCNNSRTRSLSLTPGNSTKIRPLFPNF